MNSLSWLIYLASVTSSLGMVCAIVLIGSGLIILGAFVGMMFGEWEGEDITPKPFLRHGLIVFLCVGVLGSFIPDKTTVYAMAASEVGERIVNNELVTEVAKEATTALRDWLKAQQDSKK